MRKLIPVLVFAAIGLSSCGGEDQTLTPPPPTVVDPTAPEIASVELVTNNPQIPSDGGIPATITAFVKDTSNNFVGDVSVSFSATSGGIQVVQGTTSAEGVATATLSTAGNPSNRTITVTATAGELSQSINVLVTGSQLTVTGPASLVQGDTATYTIVLVDGGGTGIAGQTVEVTSENGNSLEAMSLTTDAAGQAQVEVTATVGGDDRLIATALGLTATRNFNVSDDSFAFKSPAEDTEIVLGAVQVVTVEWLQDGVPQAGETIAFSTTRGEFVGIVGPPQVTTDAAGEASISVRADNAGPAVITADALGGPTTQLPVEFIATIPASINVQADPFTVAPGNQATVTAVIRDAANNRVKNARVQFSLDDVTGGSLSVGSSETDSQGRAQTFYTANDVVSGNQGVRITASVEVNPAISDSVDITVARRQLFVAFGTGNELEEPDIASYEVPYIAIVTDSEGNGVPDANVQFDVRSTRYSKGYWILLQEDDEEYTGIVTAVCDDEDDNGNGILDPGEFDENTNGTIEAGNVVQVVGGDALTNAEGRIDFRLRYAQLYGFWTEVRLRALITVAGNEFTEDLEFVLPVTADDVSSNGSPPGLLKPPDPAELPGIPFNFVSSPWGYGDDCSKDF